MRRDSLEQLVKILQSKIKDIEFGIPTFGDPQYKPFSLTINNFHNIPEESYHGKLCFIDGGNIHLLKAPNFVVDLTRIYFNEFEDNKKIKPINIPERIDFFTVCYASGDNENIHYLTTFIPIKEEEQAYLPDENDLIFNSFDKSLMLGGQRAEISLVSNTARLFAEWNISKIIIENELNQGDILVRDGTLQTVRTNEVRYANAAYETAISKGIIFTGLSKTSTFFTTTGYPLLSAISELSEKVNVNAWYYHPIVDITHSNHRAEIYAVKLHPSAEYVFRFEILRDQAKKMDETEIGAIIASLAENSRDYSFPGYPYGLIDADRFARVNYQEKEIHTIQVISELAKAGVWKRLEKSIKSIDAHERLNEVI
jgi:hypothetical protein